MAAATCLGSGTLALNQVKAIAEQLLAEAGGLLLRGHSSQARVVLVYCCMFSLEFQLHSCKRMLRHTRDSCAGLLGMGVFSRL